MKQAVEDMAQHGLRVLALAEASWPSETLPETQRHFAFAYRGLAGLADPIRETVPAAVRQLQDAGIRVVMITGDYPVTARTIAAQAGIEEGRVVSGEAIAQLSDEDLAREVEGASVFARVMPEQKLRIVRALKSSGEVVAMIGDGVNDAPSLKAAHIGIAMGQRGTDVARAASAIVLLDDDFGAIVTAVRLGRRIYDNIRKAAAFIFAVHVPIAGLAIAPLLAGWPLILGPVHIALIEMVIDPVCSLAFEAEPEEPDILCRNPRPPTSPLVSRRLLTWSALQGVCCLVLLLGLSTWANRSSLAEEAARSTAFAGLVASVFLLVLANRTFKGQRNGRNFVLAVVLVLTGAINAIVLTVPPVAQLFQLAPLSWQSLLAVAALALLLASVLAAGKRVLRLSPVG
jgi:Ca2+-transporting ATPase